MILGRLRDLVSGMKTEVLAEETKKESYKGTAWAHLQAHRNGNKEAFDKVLELLKFIP